MNTVNTVGVMGKGVALGFKQRFPEMYRDYVQRCELGLVKLGEPYLWQPLVEPWVLNFPTKGHWRKPSRLEDIVAGLEYLQAHYRAWGVTSLAVPPLGCGYGGLEWRVVGPTLYEHLARLEIPIELYAPFATPHEQLTPDYLGARRKASPALPEHEPASKALTRVRGGRSRCLRAWSRIRTTGRRGLRRSRSSRTSALLPACPPLGRSPGYHTVCLRTVCGASPRSCSTTGSCARSASDG